MAGSFSATGKGSASAGVAVTLPTVVAGQLMLAHVTVAGSGGLASTPSGWSQDARTVKTIGSGSNQRWSAIYTKSAVAADSGANVTFTGATGTNAIRVNVEAVPTGVSIQAVATASGTNSDSPQSPGIASRTSGEDVLVFVGSNIGPRPWPDTWDGTKGGTLLGLMPDQSTGMPVSLSGLRSTQTYLGRDFAYGHSNYPNARSSSTLRNLGVQPTFPEAAGSNSGVMSDWEDGRMSYISWPQQEAWPNASGQNPTRPPSLDLEDIAKGAYDAKIYNWFVKLRAWGQPTPFRLMWEFNGGDPPWGAGHEMSTGTGGSMTRWDAAFKAAWKRIYIIAKGTDTQIATLNTVYTGANAFTAAGSSAGATNCFFIWNSQESESSTHSRDQMYPGDAYVDMVATELYTQKDGAGHDLATTDRVEGTNGGKHVPLTNYYTASHGLKRFAPGEGGLRSDKAGITPADTAADMIQRAEAFRTMAKGYGGASAIWCYWNSGSTTNGISKIEYQPATVLTKLKDVFGDPVFNPVLDTTFDDVATPWVEQIQGRAPVGNANTRYGPDQIGTAVYRKTLNANGNTGQVIPSAYGFGEWTAITLVMSSSGPADTTAPSAPGTPTFSGTTASGVTVGWTAATDTESGITSYTVARATGSGSYADIATVTTRSFPDTGLSASTTYNYKVKATNGAGIVGAYSTAAGVTTSASSGDTTAPSAPGTPTLSSRSSSTLTIAWTAAADAESGIDHYSLLLNNVEVDTTTGLSYTYTGLNAATSYNLKVRAVNGAGLTATSAVLAATTLASIDLPPAIAAWGFDTVV